MKLQELRNFSRESLRNYRRTAFFMAFSYPAVWLVMKAVPDCMAGALIFRTETTSAEIFFSRNPVWRLFLILWNLLSFCILIPMLCSIGGWFSDKLGFTGKKRFFGNGKLYWKSLWFFGKIEVIRFLMLLPFVTACYLTVKAFEQAVLVEDAGIWLFLMIQCFILAFWTGVYYIRFCIGLSAVPFLFIEHPKISTFRAVSLSRRMLDGYHRKLLMILLTGITLPRTVSMLILFLQIRIREYFNDKQEGLTT